VAVDEARRHHVTLGIERFLGGRGDATDFRDLSILDADVADDNAAVRYRRRSCRS